MQYVNKAKIVATVGPASEDAETLRAMAIAGVNVFRVNCSHGDTEVRRRIIRDIRKINDDLGLHLAILADLQGPKLRVAEMEPETRLVDGHTLVLTTEPCVGNAERVSVTYENFARDVTEGEQVLLDDGKLVLRVESSDGESEVVARVVNGGLLSSRKGVNLPDTVISLPALTHKDRTDLKELLEQNVEWVGLSFVRSASDIVELKGLIAEKGAASLVIAKIEKPEAIREIDAIIEQADGVMVARGDLGVEVPLEEVPGYQKMIVRKCQEASKPVIIATQMMESMIDQVRPSRAEVSDVANSVLDGADAMMLSGETSVGKHPALVVEVMSRIIAEVEKSNPPRSLELMPSKDESRFVSDAVCYNTCRVASELGAKAILAMTGSGYAAFKLSSMRPNANIFVFTYNRSILNMLSLLWGVHSLFYDSFVSTDQSFRDLQEILKREEALMVGDLVVNLGSMPMGEKGKTNMMKLGYID